MAAQLISTGVMGLDEALGGGLPAGHACLVEGRSGTGKTVLGLQFVQSAAAAGHRALYISTAETTEQLQGSAASHGWDVSGVQFACLVDLEDQQTLLHPADVELPRLLDEIAGRINQARPDVLVIDSLGGIRHAAGGVRMYRHALRQLHDRVHHQGCTALLLDLPSGPGRDNPVASMAGGVILLERGMTSAGARRRRLTITKMCGAAYDDARYEIRIGRRGLELYPRTAWTSVPEAPPSAGAPGPSSGGQFPSGIDGFDDMLFGGIDRGSSMLLSGPPGAGKSAMATQMLVAAAARGEVVAVYLCDERRQSFLERGRAMGWPLDDLAGRGLVRIERVRPSELSPGELAWQIRRDVAEHGVRLLAIDSVLGCLNALGDARELIVCLQELLDYLGRQGVTSFLTLPVDHIGLAAVDIGYLVDTAVRVNIEPSGGDAVRSVQVSKRRAGRHRFDARVIVLSGEGVTIDVHADPAVVRREGE